MNNERTQITMRIDPALHKRLKHAMIDRGIKFQPLVIQLLEFWLEHPDFDWAKKAKAK